MTDKILQQHTDRERIRQSIESVNESMTMTTNANASTTTSTSDSGSERGVAVDRGDNT